MKFNIKKDWKKAILPLSAYLVIKWGLVLIFGHRLMQMSWFSPWFFTIFPVIFFIWAYYTWQRHNPDDQ